jgi:hypothetical protein
LPVATIVPNNGLQLKAAPHFAIIAHGFDILRMLFRQIFSLE